MRAALAVLLVPALAVAGPKFFTTIGATEAPVRDGVGKVKRKLDACWRGSSHITLRLTVDAGAVKAVDFVEGDPKGPIACLTKALRTVKIAASGAYELQLSSLNLDEIAASGRLENTLELVGKGKVGGHGGGGAAGGDFVAKDKQVQIQAGSSDGTAVEINRVVRARAGVFRACYQRELPEKPKLAGKIAVKFSIGADGNVTKASVTSTSMNDARVEDCLRNQILRLKFPASVGPADISYPFIFSQG